MTFSPSRDVEDNDDNDMNVSSRDESAIGDARLEADQACFGGSFQPYRFSRTEGR